MFRALIPGPPSAICSSFSLSQRMVQGHLSKLWIFCPFSNYTPCVHFQIMILFLLPKYVPSMSTSDRMIFPVPTSDIIAYHVSTYDYIMVHMPTFRLMSLGHFSKFPFTPYDYGPFAFAPCGPFRKSFPPLPN